MAQKIDLIVSFSSSSANEKVKLLVTQPSPTVCDLMDCSPPVSSVHGILQAKILE